MTLYGSVTASIIVVGASSSLTRRGTGWRRVMLVGVCSWGWATGWGIIWWSGLSMLSLVVIVGLAGWRLIALLMVVSWLTVSGLSVSLLRFLWVITLSSLLHRLLLVPVTKRDFSQS